MSEQQPASSIAEAAETLLAAIREREPALRAFAHLDDEAVRRAAHGLDAAGAEGLALRGLPVGIKDLIDTDDLPTEYGSAIYRGHRPRRDAAVVRLLRAAGALLVGKTVTTEFALFQAGPTRHPLDPGRTPGGSSSGSAAAVAAGLLPVALGTQTAGSITRPASFCGIVGFKPTFGAIDRDGVLPVSGTLDTVGLLARDVAAAAAVFDVLRSDRSAPSEAEPAARPTIGFARPPEWDQAEQSTRDGIDELKRRLPDAGFDVQDVELPASFAGLVGAQNTIMEYEAARSLGPRCEGNWSLVSPRLTELLRRGASIPERDYRRALQLAHECRSELGTVFPHLDALLVPAARGEAPPAEDGTGDPVFCRAWTLLGCPTVSLPLLTGPSGLPVGIQLVGALHDDDRLLAVAARLERWHAGEA
ncbi:Amidase [Sinomonas atrocyanea]|uniref:Amidase n=1 Tax=Sinomonas atrocyanea TaxID=37927 RepID=A0A126ZUB4_9MICC|nr:amidase [Sinomonas atrocyanea]AMM30749.1 Amidase [Sinomonas atrocyanea]GEB63795.1 amidase [Sinomonas atrocyanea]GGG74267.1 amidase [Sinomonas atrocyanea]